jgi:hypothetical protein
MRDRELYRQLMGLREPWKVTEVKVDFDGLKVDVWVEWPAEQPGGVSRMRKGLSDIRPSRRAAVAASRHHAVSDNLALPGTAGLFDSDW